jgi:hypothetical protein
MNSNTYISVSIFFSTKQLFDYNSECVRVDNLKMHLIIFVNVTSESQKKIPSAVVIQYRAWYLFLRLRCYIPGIILVSARLLRIALNTLKYGSEEKGSSLCRCSILLGFIVSKNLRGLWFCLLIKVQNATSLVFLT